MILIAEKPVEQPRLDTSGRVLHNSYYISQVPMANFIQKLGRHVKIVPYLKYLAENIVSRQCHYLTTDWGDPNIRQVVVKITKSTAEKKLG